MVTLKTFVIKYAVLFMAFFFGGGGYGISFVCVYIKHSEKNKLFIDLNDIEMQVQISFFLA